MSAKRLRTILVIAGMPGAGKSLASDAARELGLPVLVSGDVIREEARKRGLQPNKANLGRLMLGLRGEEGMSAVARRLIPLIEKTGKVFVVYEGARNVEEVEELRKNYRVLTIAIHAAPETRFHRLLKRLRSDRPRNKPDFRERDQRELRVGVGKVIALADRMVENEESKHELRRRMKRLLKKTIQEKWSESSLKPRLTIPKTRKKSPKR